MNQPLAQNSDRPFASNKALMINQEPEEHPALNWAKLIFLILLTYGLMVAMWFIWYSFLLSQQRYRNYARQQRPCFIQRWWRPSFWSVLLLCPLLRSCLVLGFWQERGDEKTSSRGSD